MVHLQDRDLTVATYQAITTFSRIGIDIETSGLNKELDRIATVQIAYGDNVVIVRNLQQPVRLLSVLSNARIQKIFHYGIFDLSFLMRDYQVIPMNIADTKITAQLVDPKKEKFIHPITGKGSLSLIALVWFYFEVQLDKSIAVSDWFSTLSQEQINYAAEDVRYLPALLDKLLGELSPFERQKAEFLSNAIPVKILLDRKELHDIYAYA